MMGSLAGLAGICVGTYLVFLALDKLAQQKEIEEHECHCHDIDGDCPHDCCGCHDCCHKDDEEK